MPLQHRISRTPENLAAFGKSGSVGPLLPCCVLPADTEAGLAEENGVMGVLHSTCIGGTLQAITQEPTTALGVGVGVCGEKWPRHPHLPLSSGSGVLRRLP